MVQYPAEQNLGTMLTEYFGSVPVRASHRSMPSCMTSLSLSGDAVPMQTPLKEKEDFPKLQKLQRLFDEDCASTTYLPENSLVWENSITLISLGFWTLQSFVLCVKDATSEAQNKQCLVNTEHFVQIADGLRLSIDQVACLSARCVGQVANSTTPPSPEHLTLGRSQPSVIFFYATFSTSILQLYLPPSLSEQLRSIVLHVQNAYLDIAADINDQRRHFHQFQLHKSSLIRYTTKMSSSFQFNAFAMEFKPRFFSSYNTMEGRKALNPEAASFSPVRVEEFNALDQKLVLNSCAQSFTPGSGRQSTVDQEDRTLLNKSTPTITPCYDLVIAPVKPRVSSLNACASLFVPTQSSDIITEYQGNLLMTASSTPGSEMGCYDSENQLFTDVCVTVCLPSHNTSQCSELQNDLHDVPVNQISFSDTCAISDFWTSSISIPIASFVVELTANTGQLLKRSPVNTMLPSSFPHEKYKACSEPLMLRPDQCEDQRQKFKIDWTDIVPHHFSWTGEPIHEKCHTPAALSLSLIRSITSKPKGLAFGHQNSLRKSLLMKQALLLIDPVVFIGESKNLEGLTGSKLQDAATGQTFKLYSVHGWWHDGEYETYFDEDEEPFMDNLQSAQYHENDLVYNGWHPNHDVPLREHFIEAEFASSVEIVNRRRESIALRNGKATTQSALRNAMSRDDLVFPSCLDNGYSPHSIGCMSDDPNADDACFIWADEADAMVDELFDFEQKLRECLTSLQPCTSSERSSSHEKHDSDGDLRHSFDIISTVPTDVDIVSPCSPPTERADTSELLLTTCSGTKDPACKKDEEDSVSYSGSQFDSDAPTVELAEKGALYDEQSEKEYLYAFELESDRLDSPTLKFPDDDELLSLLESFSPIKPASLQEIVESACRMPSSAACPGSINLMPDSNHSPIPFTLGCKNSEPFSDIDWNALQSVESDSGTSQEDITEETGYPDQKDVDGIPFVPESMITSTRDPTEHHDSFQTLARSTNATLTRTQSFNNATTPDLEQRKEGVIRSKADDDTNNCSSDDEDSANDDEIRQYIAEMNRKLDEIEYTQQLTTRFTDLTRPRTRLIQQGLRCGEFEILPPIQSSPVKANEAMSTCPITLKRRQISDPASLLGYRQAKAAITNISPRQEMNDAVIMTELEVAGDVEDKWTNEYGLLPAPQLPTFKSIRTAPSMRQRISKMVEAASFRKPSFANYEASVKVKPSHFKSLKKSIKSLFKQEMNVLH